MMPYSLKDIQLILEHGMPLCKVIGPIKILEDQGPSIADSLLYIKGRLRAKASDVCNTKISHTHPRYIFINVANSILVPYLTCNSNEFNVHFDEDYIEAEFNITIRAGDVANIAKSMLDEIVEENVIS